jgi:tetratricopeptide (TPR) repeat protein
LKRAEHHFRKALEIQPRSSVTHAYFGLYLAQLNFFQEATASMRTSLELDPLSPFVHGVAGLTLVSFRSYEEAMQRGHEALELQPNFVIALWARLLAACYWSRGQEVFEASRKLALVTRRSSQFLGVLAMAHSMAGQEEKALTFQQEPLERREFGEYVNPIAFLAADVGFDNMESARAHLLAYFEDGGNGWTIKAWIGSANLDKLVAHPPCAEVLRKIGLVDLIGPAQDAKVV